MNRVSSIPRTTNKRTREVDDENINHKRAKLSPLVSTVLESQPEPCSTCTNILEASTSDHAACIEHYCNVKETTDVKKIVALFHASSRGHISAVRTLLHYLLFDNLTIDQITHTGIHILHMTCGIRKLQIVQELVGVRKANVNFALKKDDLTPLHICASFGAVDCLKYLLENGGDPTLMTSESKMNPLHFAANNGKLECCKILVEHDPSLLHSVSTKNQRTVLHFALLNEKFDCYRWLLEKGAATTLDANGQSALFCLPARECNLTFQFQRYFKSFAERRKWFTQSLLDLEKPHIGMRFHRGRLFPTLKILCSHIKKSLNKETLFKRFPFFDLTFFGELGKGSGVNREWFREMEKEVIRLDILQNCATPGNLFFKKLPCGETENPRENRLHAALMGLIFSLAFTYGHVHAVPLPNFLFKMVLGYPINIEDLKPLDQELYESKVVYLRNCSDQDIADLSLTFSQVEYMEDGSPREVNFKENGNQIVVDKDNLEEYLHLFVMHEIFYGRRDLIQVFVATFNLFAPRKSLKALFSPMEIFDSLMGKQENIDMTLWKEMTHYEGCGVDSPLVEWFWEAVEKMTPVDRKHLVSFCTGSDQLPVSVASPFSSPPFLLLCDQSLSPLRIPTSRTCFKTLVLPNFPDKETLFDKLHTVVAAQKSGGLGFGFV